MTSAWTIERPLPFRRGKNSRVQQAQQTPVPAEQPLPAGRVPRVARLMALALRFEKLLRAGEIASYAELGRLGHVTRARVCQIMNLTCLAPDIQEALLFLPRTQHGRDRIILADLQPIAALLDWRLQRRRWAEWTKAAQKV
jgi:hypothetical protein